jgi:nicotinamide-nucleotide amidase
MLASRITEVPGSSDVFPGGVVSYSNEAKTELVMVPAKLIAEYGAVSPQVAEQLAAGARLLFAADYGIGITGVAGPGGGSRQKPVGLVYIAVADSAGVQVDDAHFTGSRHVIRYRSTQTALVMLRARLLAA